MGADEAGAASHEDAQPCPRPGLLHDRRLH